MNNIFPEVRQTLIDIKQLYGYSDDDGVLQGFVGAADDKIEKLTRKTKSEHIGRTAQWKLNTSIVYPSRIITI